MFCPPRFIRGLQKAKRQIISAHIPASVVFPKQANIAWLRVSLDAILQLSESQLQALSALFAFVDERENRSTLHEMYRLNSYPC